MMLISDVIHEIQNHMDNISPILNFYIDKNILITGATGFIGKVLLEKLLRCCPQIGSIYVLIRSKKGLDASKRLNSILSERLFDNIKLNYPNITKKVVPIQGDITENNYGLSEEDLNIIKDSVSVVFNSAATIKFNENLRNAINLNVLSVFNLLNLCREIRNLKALVHVSTAYSNCHKDLIKEKIYKMPIHPYKIIDLLNWMDDSALAKITPEIVQGWPNTYTYTKAMAEQILAENHGTLPIIILRPSIVCASWKEPMPGWIDNYNGPTGMLAAMGKGLLRIMLGKHSATADIIPVDITANYMIVLAWYVSQTLPAPFIEISETSANIQVFHCTSGTLNKLTWGQLQSYMNYSLNKIPLIDMIRTPRATFTSSKLWYAYCKLADHLVPGYLIDGGRWVIGLPPKILPLYSKLHRALNSFDFFTQHHWEFANDNYHVLMKNLAYTDKQTFFLDIGTLEWGKYIENYCLGTKGFLMGEDTKDMARAKTIYLRVKCLSYLINFVLISITFKFVQYNFSDAHRLLWHYFTSLKN